MHTQVIPLSTCGAEVWCIDLVYKYQRYFVYQRLYVDNMKYVVQTCKLKLGFQQTALFKNGQMSLNKLLRVYFIKKTLGKGIRL